MSTEHTFGTAINCIDGRTQQPVAQWIKEHYHVAYIDMVTEPGADKALATGTAGLVDALKAKVNISINAHYSTVVAIAGHHGCAANPVSQEEHRSHILSAVQRIAQWGLPITVVGLWVGPEWQVESVVVVPAKKR